MLTLSNQTVQVLVIGAFNVQIATANVVNCLVVYHEGTIGVLERGVRGEDRIVWLHDTRRDLRCWVNTELQLAFLAIVNRQTLHQKCAKAGTSTTTKGVEDQETLETRAVVGNTANLVQNLVNEFLSNSVVTTGVVVGGILLSGNHLFGVEQAAVGTGSDLVDNVGLEIAVDGTWDIFALALEELA